MKRVLSFILVAAMLLAIPVMPVTAQAATTEANVTDPTSNCPCCGVPMDQLEWLPWDDSVGLTPAPGHYYLSKNYEQTTIKTIMADVDVVLDLRGYKWSSYKPTDHISLSYHQMLYIQGNFFLMDTVGNGVVESELRPNTGGAFYLKVNEWGNPMFHMLSGTIRPRSGNINYRPGGMAYVGSGCVFKMTGGCIENYTIQYDADKSGGVSAIYVNGGAINGASNSQIQIHGGMIRNCTASQSGGAIYSSGELELKNCIIMNCSAGVNGGAVYSTGTVITDSAEFINCSAYDGGAVYATTQLNMKNDTVMNCTASYNGGGVYLKKGSHTIENTRFIANTAKKWGGNICQDGGGMIAKNMSLEHGVANCMEGAVANMYQGGGNYFAMNSAVASFEGGTIRDGYSANHGGNIQLSASTLTLKNTNVYGGVTYKTGDNIRTHNSAVTLDGAQISGDMVFEKNTLTLKNNTKIGLNNTGLCLYDTATVVNASGLTEGAEIYVQVSAACTVATAGANMEYFKPAYRTSLAGGDGKAITATVEDDKAAGYCPHCKDKGKTVSWTKFAGQNTTGHYYLEGDYTCNIEIAAANDVVIDLNSYKLTNDTERYINKGTLTVMDSGAGRWVDRDTQWIGGKVVGSGLANNNGGVIHNNGTFNLYGGTLVYVENADRNVERGGVVYLFGGTMNMYGGVLDGSAYNNTTATGWVSDDALPEGVGGAFYQNVGSTFTMTTGRMIGGTAYAGGTAGFGNNVTTTITGGSFCGGSAATGNGGNLYFSSADVAEGSVSVSNVSVTNGTAAAAGGNIAFGRYNPTTFKNCFIADGKTTAEGGHGGNLVMATAGLATIQNSIILSGEARKGGNVSVNGTSANIALDTCRLIAGKTPEGAGNNGGNLMVTKGRATIKGGELAYGIAGGATGGVGGNICGGTSGTVVVQKNSAGAAPRILNGFARYGGNISVLGAVTLTDAYIGGGNTIDQGKDIQISGDYAALTVGSGVTGKVSVWPKETKGVVEYGQILGGTSANNLSSELNIFLESKATKPSLVVSDGKLAVAAAQGTDANGNTLWYVGYSEAAEAVGSTGIVKLYTNADLILTKNTYVDLNGKTVTITDGEEYLLGMDSTGDSYTEPMGKVTFTGTSPVADKSMVYAPNGNKYVALVENGAVTFHRLGADLTSVTINIDKNAVYFKGVFGADKKLKALIDTYGIAVSLSGMPDERLTESHMTSYEGSTMANGETANGVSIINILKEDLTKSQNDNRGRDKIYATAYVKLNDGTTTYISDQSGTEEDNVAWSLYDAFNRLDELIDEDPTYFRKYTNDMRNYYEKWKNLGIKDWIRENTNFVEPEDDGVLDILMIGSSFCSYYVEELSKIAEDADVPVRVCNVYFSGCPLSKYWTDWKNNIASYQFYTTIKGERKGTPGSKSLEWCLAQGEWDVISMQEYSGNIRNDTAEAHLSTTDRYTDDLFPYITSQFPNAKFYFHQTWSFQDGYNRNGYVVDSPAKQAEDAYKQQQFALGLLKKYGNPETSGIQGSEYQCIDGRIPTGEAWQLVREGWGGYAKYDNLCKRTGTANNLGDYYHDGDLGGGQYLNALVWFFQIMKDRGVNLTVEDIKWQPDDTTYSVKLADGLNLKQLKACAWEAVYGSGWTYDEAKYTETAE